MATAMAEWKPRPAVAVPRTGRPEPMGRSQSRHGSAEPERRGLPRLTIPSGETGRANGMDSDVNPDRP